MVSRKLVAPVATLVLTLLFVNVVTVSADARTSGQIVVDGTLCWDPEKGIVARTLSYGELVSIFSWVEKDGMVLIQLDSGMGAACYVDKTAVEQVTGGSEPVIATPELQDPATEPEHVDDVTPEGAPPAEETSASRDSLGDITVNADEAACLSAPDGEFVTYLWRGQLVTQYADGVSEGWQLVGFTESDAPQECYVLQGFLGEAVSSASTDAAAATAAPDETAPEPPADADGLPLVVNKLPSTGSGDTGGGWTLFGLQIGAGLGFLVALFVIPSLIGAVCARLWDERQSKRARTR